MAQTKQKGFYVSLGEVQLLKEKGGFGSTPVSNKKPKSSAGRDKSGSGAEDEKATSGTKRKKGDDDPPGYLGGYAADGRKRRKIENEDGNFTKELQALVDDMKAKVKNGESLYSSPVIMYIRY